jgi:hypothetical protein
MKNLIHLILAGLLWLPCVAAQKPNIILIMSDDVGYSDIGCYGGEIATPTLDALAQGGVRFTQFYNTARCCPTRAALLTGLYAPQAGIGHMVDGPGPKTGSPAYSGELSRNAVTIAEALKSGGYATYMAGKWHVTQKTSASSEQDKENWPRQRGFDRFYGTIRGAGSFFDPSTLVRDNTFISPFVSSTMSKTRPTSPCSLAPISPSFAGMRAVCTPPPMGRSSSPSLASPSAASPPPLLPRGSKRAPSRRSGTRAAPAHTARPRPA